MRDTASGSTEKARSWSPGARRSHWNHPPQQIWGVAQLRRACRTPSRCGSVLGGRWAAASATSPTPPITLPSHPNPISAPPPSRPTREIASVQCEWLQLVHSLVSAGGKAFRPAGKALERPPRPPHPQDTVHCQVRPAEHGRMSCIERWPSCRSLAGRPGPIRLSNLNGRGRWNGPHVCTTVLSCGVRSVDP